MHRTFTLALAAAGMTLTPAAADGPDIYAEAAYAFIGGDGDDFNAVGARLGVDFNDYIGAESEVFFGVEGGTFSDLDFELGGYAVGNVSLTQNIGLFARLGYAYSQFSLGGTGFEFDDDGIATGAGFKVDFGPKIALRTGYTFQDIASDAHIFDAALVYKFGK
ncbi:MAG: outer membrane beta-barrel protein [Pseudomonadota bacterium]